jgi:hypothetical protein
MRGFGIFLIVWLLLCAAISLFIVVSSSDKEFPSCTHEDWPMMKNRKGMALSLFFQIVLIVYVWLTLPQE